MNCHFSLVPEGRNVYRLSAGGESLSSLETSDGDREYLDNKGFRNCKTKYIARTREEVGCEYDYSVFPTGCPCDDQRVCEFFDRAPSCVRAGTSLAIEGDSIRSTSD